MPSVYDYEDFRSFVQAWLGERRARTQRLLAKRLKCSDSTISCVLHSDPKRRRPLGEDIAQRMCGVLGLNEPDAHFFLLLVRYDQLDGEREKAMRAEIRMELSALRRLARSRKLREEQYHFFAKWQYGALLELSRCEGFQSNPRWIAKTLHPKLSQTEIRRTIAELVDLHLLAHAPDGSLVPTDDMVFDDWQVDPDVRREALNERNRWALKQSSRALAEIPANQRHFSTLTFSVDQQQLDEIRATLQRCMLRVVEICNASGNSPDRVFELDMQLFPLSGPTRPDPNDNPSD